MTEICIPKNITVFSEYLYDMKKLKSISVDISNQNFTSREGVLFNKDCTQLIRYPSAKADEVYTIPDSVVELKNYAFQDAVFLKTINLPNQIVDLGRSTFKGCENLTEISIPQKISAIYDSVFENCRSLEEINIPEGVTSVDSNAFSGCEFLSKVTIPKTLVKIGNNAFNGCTNLHDIYINDLISWYNIKFENDKSNPLCNYANIWVGNNLLKDVNFPSNTTIIKSGIFNNCTSIENVYLPETTTQIEAGAFRNCISLLTIYIPQSVSYIGSAAFSNCQKLKTINLPKAIKQISDDTFYGCLSLDDIIIPENVTTIGNEAFNGCEKLNKITFPAAVTKVGSGAFGKCKTLSAIFFPDSVNILGSYICSECSALKKVRLPAQITSIPVGMFEKSGLEEIYIPKTVVSVGKKAFNETNVKKVLFGGDNSDFDKITFSLYNDTVKKSTVDFVYGCDDDKYIPAAFEINEVEVNVGYTATVLNEKSRTKCIHWYSDTPDIAHVDEFGEIKGIAEGVAVITAEDDNGNLIDACVVTVVEPIHVQSISLSKTALSIVQGKSETITATILPQDATNKEITWLSDNKNIATVENGVITAISPGTTNIKAISLDNEMTATCVVSVEQLYPLTGIKFDKTKLNLDAGASETINVIYTPENATNKNLKWTSSKSAVATVEDGIVKGITAGTAIIVATSDDGGYKATCIVTVVQPVKVKSVSLNRNSIDIISGETETLIAEISPDNATNKNLIWSSDDKNIASVENGIITAKRVGTTKIKVITEDGQYSSECSVNVLPVPVTRVSLDKSEVSLKIGSSEKLTATVIPETAENKNVKWSSDDNDVVSVDENGNVTAKSIGTAIVTATTEVGGFTAQCTVTVLPIVVSDITLDKTELSIAEGTLAKVSASVFPENATDKTVLWSSNNENVATVENGTITAVSQGTAVIVAKTKDGSHTAYCAVTVTAANVPVKSISLNQSTLTIVEGYTDTLTATISPSNATNKTITWSTNNSKVATVENGTVQAIAPGTAVIIATAEDGGRIATCIVNVISSMQDSVSKPIASILSGAVKEGANVLLLCATRGAQIHYTTDGSAPSKDSPLYTEPIQINSAVKIKAIALKNGMLDSEVASFSYTIADPDIPYVSVQTNLTGNKGDITTVSVNISENSGSAGGSFNLVYDNTAVELMSVENGSYISKANPIVNDTYAANKVRTVWAGSKKLDGGGEILTAQFRILDDTDKDTAYFSLEKLKIADDNAVKMKCVQSDGVLALMTAESAVQDKEFVTEPTFGTDNKTVSVLVTSNEDYSGKMYVAVYDTNNKLIQLKCTDVKNNEVPYDIVFDKEMVPGQCVKVFIWNEVMCPLSDVKMLYK